MPTTKEMIQDSKMKAEVEVQAYAAMETQLDVDLKAAQDAGYDQAVADQNLPADTKLYTEEDLQAEKAVLQAQIDKLAMDQANAAQAQADAVAAAKASQAKEIAAKIRDTQVDDQKLAEELEASI